MIAEMAALQILGPIELFAAAVDVIQDSGALHIVETPLAEFGRANLLSKIHLTENQAQERDACAKTAGSLDEMVAEIPAHIVRALRGTRAVAPHYDRMKAEPLEALSARAHASCARANLRAQGPQPYG